jgi:hypothetical protein
MRSKSACACSSPGWTNALLAEELLLPDALPLDELLLVDELLLEPAPLLEELLLDGTGLLDTELPPAPDVNEDELDTDTPELDPSDVPEL